MPDLYVDTNFIVSYLYKRNDEQYIFAESFLLKARKGRERLVLVSEIVIEVEYVLHKIYKLQKKEVIDMLESIVQAPYIVIPNREVLLKTLVNYRKENIDLVDCILYEKAHANSGNVLSFDKDFKKLKT